ncbi:MAG: HD domain-containing phosphohydrolase [bacterium]
MSPNRPTAKPIVDRARSIPDAQPHPPRGAVTLDALKDEGLALERRGQREEARRHYALGLSDEAALSQDERAQLLRWTARTFMQDSDFSGAESAAHAALAMSESANDMAGRGHAVNMLAVIRYSQGDLDGAEPLYVTARDFAHRAGEVKLAVMTATNLGIIATIRGDEHQAQIHYESGLSEAREAGLADQAMLALNNLGMLHAHTNHLVEADRAFREALGIARVLGDMNSCIRTLLNIAGLRIRQGNHVDARDACDEAVSMAHQIGDNHADGEAEYVYGLIGRATGDNSTAEAHFLRAESIALERQDLILQGEASRELAVLYRHQGRNRQTLQRLNQSHRVFAQLRARRELADVDRRTSMLEGDFLDVARKWGDSIESKDEYTQGHCVRVADLACSLWVRVCAGDDTSLFWFRIGALLHDVGKLMVPAEVLNKPGKLTDEEWGLMRRHTTAGVELLADIEFPWDVRPIVESHHERWDGRGYPHGLAGEAIPITARVLGIADVYDALTSERSYKKAFTHDEAMNIMRSDVGKAFDPTLFASFEEIVRRGTWRHTPSSGMLALAG